MPPWGFLPPAGKSKPLYLPWWISESVIGGGVYLREPWACTYPGLVLPGLMNPCLLILAWSLCNQLSLDALVLDSLSSAQSLILDVLILLLCNGPLMSLFVNLCIPVLMWSCVYLFSCFEEEEDMRLQRGWRGTSLLQTTILTLFLLFC